MKLISMVAVAKAMGINQIAQYLGKTFKEHKESNYMVTTEECSDFLKAQVMKRLKYKEEAQVMLDSKDYLEMNELVPVASTTKKANTVKKGTIVDLRKFLELKGLTEEFSEMLNSGNLED